MAIKECKIKKECKITISGNTASIDKEIYLYKNDMNIKCLFDIVNSDYVYTKDSALDNVINASKASYAQVKFKKDDIEIDFDVQETSDGKAIIYITEELTDEDTELGDYTIQIRLFDESKTSVITLPPVNNCIHIMRPIFEKVDGSTNVVDEAAVDEVIVTYAEPVASTNADGTFAKKTWVPKEKITTAELNRMEEGISYVSSQFKNIANKNIMQKTSNDTEELKRIIAKAKLNKTNIVIPSGDWHINTDEIILDFDGLTIEGENSWGTKIISTGSGVLFKLLNGAGEIRNPIFKNLFIEGSNKELYEGIAFDCGGDTYAGRAIKFENVQIRYFETGIKLKHIDNCLFSNTGISYCNKNIHLVEGGNCNTITFNNTMTSNATETSILLESGSGLVIQGGDHVNCEQIRVKNSNTQVTVIGGNFENCTNEGAFVVETNATLTGIGNRFLKQSTGQDIEQCKVYKNGRLTLISPITGGYSKSLIKKLDSSMVQVYSPTTSIYSGGNEINDMDKAIYRGNGGIESRLGSGVPSATNRMRGMTLFLAQPDGSNLTDRLLQYVKLSDGSYKALDLLQGSLYFTDSSSSFNQSTSAKILNGKKYTQTLSKELEYTDVVVNIGAYTKLYNCVCSIYDGSGRDFRVIHKSHNPSTGDITFRVFHGTLTSDTTTCINYTISIDI